MDSFELNKIAGGVLIAFLIVLGTGMLSELIFEPHHPEKPGYKVDVADNAANTTSVKKDEITPILPMLANADISAGETIFSGKCSSCHTKQENGPNRVGPNLYNIINQKIGHSQGYKYSKILQKYNAEDKKWTYEEMNKFLKKPRAYAKGTKMGFAGLKKDKDRANIISYLRTLSQNPAQLD